MTPSLALDPIEALVADLGDIPHSRDEAVRRRKSRDFYWTSPVLKASLDHCLADLVAMPRDEADVVRIAAACARHRVPITPRGGGTGNYGQAVPTHGGVVIDMSGLDTVFAIGADEVTAGAGITLGKLDRAVREAGLELLHFPSTKQTGTVGGYFAGGSAGVGAVAHGGLREPGNLRGTRLVTIEETPRVLDLEAADAQVIMHSFGAIGLVTRIRMPLAPARDWLGFAVRFVDMAAATRFASATALDGGIEKKLVSVLDAPLVAMMGKFPKIIGGAGAVVLAMIAPASRDAFLAAADEAGGAVVLQQETSRIEAERSGTPIYEYSYGHSSLLALKTEPTLSYTQILCPMADVERILALLDRDFGAHVLHHLEYMVFDGEMFCAFYPMIRNSTPDLVDAIAAACEATGLRSANPHVSTVEGGSGYKQLEIDLVGWKRRTDPYGLLNPGKL